ncbi:MAG: diguanylate cyclase [Campylobacterales bacterium]
MQNWIDQVAARPALHRLFFVLLLIVFGLAVSAGSFFTAQYNQAGNIDKELRQAAQELAEFKAAGLKTALDNHRSRLSAARESAVFQAYLQNPAPARLKQVTELFTALAASSGDIYQFRYLNAAGDEVVRIERNRPGNTPFAVEETLLQNKADRYYFTQSATLPKGSTWFSKVDLNVERGQVELPIVPTLRIASPLYDLRGFQGIVIINLYLEPLLENLTYSPSFSINLVDREGHFLIDRAPAGRSWSRYLDASGKPYPRPLEGENPAGLEHLKTAFYTQPIETVLPTADRLTLTLEPRLHTVQERVRSQNIFMLTTLGIVLVLSIPLALMLSALPTGLNERLLAAQGALKKQWETIDRFVLLTRTDHQGVITYATDAYCELTGYSKAELVGKTHALVRHPDTPAPLYQQMWTALKEGRSWQGELQNRRKDGSAYWLKMSIEPSEGGYACYMQEITYQKRVEELSITDELTGLNNRRSFNEYGPEMLAQNRRRSEGFAFLILDVDHFKKYNDTYGHEAGDRVLKSVGRALKGACKRPGDRAFRLGGEEFAVLFSYEEAEGAREFAQQVRAAIEALGIEHRANSAAQVVTASFGLALRGDDIDDYYKKADEALYEAKEGGRNRVCVR